MKTRATTTAHGHVIILTLIVCLLLGSVLFTVISLTTNEGQLTGRSQSWNGALPMAEAGIEEAFTHLKYCPTNRASNGWVLVNDQYIKSRTMGASWYEVSISTNYDPIITARGGVRAPIATNYIARTVRVMATNVPMFSAAIEALDGIFFNSGNVIINSYDSRDNNYSNDDGSYNPLKFKDKGKVVCHYGPFEMGGSKIYGHVETGEESALTIGSQGVVGSIDYHSTVGKGIQDGWHTGTTASEFSNVDPPPIGPLPPRSGGGYVIGDGIFTIDSLSGSVVVVGHATLTVNSDFRPSSFIIETNASVKLYVNAASVSFQPIKNMNIRAESFMYYGLPNNLAISMQGNASFCGVLYAPNAMLQIGGGGKDEVDFLGAIIARMVTVKGKMTFHFDEAVQRLGSRGFVAYRWDEL